MDVAKKGHEIYVPKDFAKDPYVLKFLNFKLRRKRREIKIQHMQLHKYYNEFLFADKLTLMAFTGLGILNLGLENVLELVPISKWKEVLSKYEKNNSLNRK